MADMLIGPLVSLLKAKASSYLLDQSKCSDVFDEFMYEALRRDAKKKGHYSMLGMDVVSLFPTHNPIVFRYRMGKKLRRIVQAMEVLVEEMKAFGFTTQKQQVPPSMMLLRQADSIMVDSEKDLVRRSRNEEKEKIVKILLEQDGNGAVPMVLPIIGMGNLGKTTFVQLIYNDPQVQKHFSFLRWCCVSEDFDIKYLIVLDDVWNRDPDKWGKLMTCLKQGDRGSAILTTTRDEEYIKEIIQSRAFSVQKPKHDELDVILDKVVDRCVGSPLAAKAFGAMLSTKTSIQEWKDILAKSNICNQNTEIFPILKLSYDDLPPNMKSLMWREEDNNPDTVGNQIFNQLAWRSFFQDIKQTTPPVDIYRKRHQLRYRKVCKLHDLMHDVATSIMRKECRTVADRSNQKSLSDPTRHMFISYKIIGALFNDFLMKQSPTLQTLLYQDSYVSISTPYLSKFNSLRALRLCALEKLPFKPRHLQHLRYLNMSGNLWIKTYFVVGTTSGCSSVGELQNISLGGELHLNGLKNATEEHAKAASLGSKETLTHLALTWNTEGHEEVVKDSHKKVLDALKPPSGLEMLRINNYKSSSIPAWMKDLSFFLQHLTELRLVGCTMCEDFPEFSQLKALQVLHLKRLHKLQSLCRDTAFIDFPELKELELCDLKSLERWAATKGNGDELNFSALEKICIENCPKNKAHLSLSLISSGYMSSLSLLELSVSDTEATLELDRNHELAIPEMKITGCSFFFTSPSRQIVGIWKWFGQLRTLEIRKCNSVIYWPEEEFISLISLTTLVVTQCSKLTGRAPMNGGATVRAEDRLLPQLKKLKISYCEILTELFVLPPSIKDIIIDECSNLQFILGKDDTESMSVKGLFIDGIWQLAELSNLPPSIRKLFIYRCPELRSITGHLDGLLQVTIVGCNKLETPDWGNMPALHNIWLSCCKRVTSLPGSHGSYSALIRVQVEYCPALDMKPVYAHLPQRLDILEYKDLSLARSSDPDEGPILREPKSWKYAILGCKG
ncbi:hypothetical protein BS78_01G265300 [Paspalum vaginatum]|nr:hypothetical protein BS78_01G265300 [Paspalum vaginatum]